MNERYYTRSLINGKQIYGEQYTKLNEDEIEIRFVNPSNKKENQLSFEDLLGLHNIKYCLECSQDNTVNAWITSLNINIEYDEETYYILTIKLREV